MPNPNLSRLEKYYIGPQSAFRTVPNSSGAWTTTGVKWLRASRMVLTPNIGYQDAPYKSTTRSGLTGYTTRRGGTWSLPGLPIILSGVAGTAPDMDGLFQGVFGQASTGGISNNVYAFSDTGQVPFILADYYKTASTETQRLAWGCCVEEITFRFNGNTFECDASGSFGYMLDSDNFANEDSIAKAGLTNFPVDPALSTVAGNPMTGFTGSVSVDSNAMEADLGNMTVRIRTGNVLVADRYKDAYAQYIVGGLRQVSCAISLLDSDSTAAVNLKSKAKSRTPINISLVIGNTGGYTATFAIKQVPFLPPSFEDGAAFVSANFGDSMAHATAAGNIDDLVMTLS